MERTNILAGPEDCWRRIDHTDHPVVHAGSPLAEEDRMSSPDVVGHNLEALHRTEVLEVDSLAGRNLAGRREVPVAGSPGLDRESIGCMGLTYWLSDEC